MTSFAVVFALGGGPAATTIELAIYQALRFEFDLNTAAHLALVQFVLCGSISVIALALTKPVSFGAVSGFAERWDAPQGFARIMDYVVLSAVVLFVASPLIMVGSRGVAGLMLGLPNGLVRAASLSIVIALTSAAMSVAMALLLAALITGLKRGQAILIEGLGLLMLAASPFVVGTGLFIVINPFMSPFAAALPITALINAAMSLPFALRVLITALAEADRNFGRLSASLGIEGLDHWRLVLWPVLKRPLGFAAGLAAALSMGDLGVITLFAPPGIETLPLFMYNLMGAYRMPEAAGAGLILVLLAVSMFWFFDRGGRIDRSV